MESAREEHILSHSLSIFFFLISFSHKAFNNSLCPEQPSPAPFCPIKNPEEWQRILQAPYWSPGDSWVDMDAEGHAEPWGTKNDLSLPSPSSKITWKVLLQEEKKKNNTSKVGTKRKLSLEIKATQI